MEQAASVLILDDWHALSNASVVVAREAAMGFAIRESRRFQSPACALRIRAQGEDDVPPGDRNWDELGLSRHSIWIDRSYTNRVALPALGKAVALLAAPEALEADLRSAGSPAPLGKQNGHLVYGFSSLAQGALLASEAMVRHPEARIGLDYRAVLYEVESAQRWDRALALASASLTGAVALSETAALALSLQNPSANVQPMGLMRARASDLPIFGLFPKSHDQLGQ